MAQDAGVLNPTTSHPPPEPIPNDHSVNRGTELRRPRSHKLRQIWQSIENWWETKGLHLLKHKTFAKEPEINGSTSSSNPPRGGSAPSSLLQPPESRGIEGGIVPELPKPISRSSFDGSASQVGSVELPQIPSLKTLGPNALAPGQKLVERYRTILFRDGESNQIARRMFLDIGADANLMVERVQKTIGAELKPCNRHITWGDREEITHIGEVEVDWYFEGKGVTYTTTFVVIPGDTWFDTLLGYDSINEYKLLVENGRVCAVRHANQPGVEGGSNDE